MSNVRSIDLMLVAELVEFQKGPGYVLDFSDWSFSEFFATELDADIDDPMYAETGTSKGKRLRCFLQKVDDPTAIRTLRALSEYRAALLARCKLDDPSRNSEGRLLSLIKRLGGSTESSIQEPPKRALNPAKLQSLQEDLLQVSTLEPQARGYAFETFLREAFNVFGLAAREPFRNRGEQIDGSFILGNETYLLEARWRALETGAANLRAFNGMVEEKAAWTRGLFVSYAGFSYDGLHAFGRAKRIICMDGLDLHDTLSREIPLSDVLERKVRRAAETGNPFVQVRDLFPR